MSGFDPSTLTDARVVLHRVAAHVVARARQQATGRFSLRVTPGGFGTPEFGADSRRLRVSGGTLVVESDAEGEATARSVAISGATLRQLADAGDVDLDLPLDVGHDTPEKGDVDAAIALDPDGAAALADCYATIAAVLDSVVLADRGAARSVTLPRLWPEHFDVAIEMDVRPDLRVNLGGSPGDSFCPEPYLYVGPWTADRPGDPIFWNAPFGAYATLASFGADQRSGAARFLLDGVERLS